MPETSPTVRLPTNPYIEVVFATFIMGSSGVFIKYLSLPPIVLSCFRLLIPTVLLAIFFGARRQKLFKYSVRWMLAGSLLNAIRIYFFMNSFAYTGLTNAVIILYTWPIFATLFGRLILRERIELRNGLLLLLPLAGILLIFSDEPLSLENDDFVGMSSMLLSAVLYALSVIVFKREAGRYSGYETVFFQNLVGSIIFLPFLWLTDFELTVVKTGVLLIFGSSIGILAFGLFFSALKKIKAATVSMMSYLEVLFATTYGVLVYHEQLSWNFLLGGSLIIAATLLLKKR